MILLCSLVLIMILLCLLLMAIRSDLFSPQGQLGKDGLLLSPVESAAKKEIMAAAMKQRKKEKNAEKAAKQQQTVASTAIKSRPNSAIGKPNEESVMDTSSDTKSGQDKSQVKKKERLEVGRAGGRPGSSTALNGRGTRGTRAEANITGEEAGPELLPARTAAGNRGVIYNSDSVKDGESVTVADKHGGRAEKRMMKGMGSSWRASARPEGVDASAARYPGASGGGSSHAASASVDHVGGRGMDVVKKVGRLRGAPLPHGDAGTAKNNAATSENAESMQILSAKDVAAASMMNLKVT
jgi:hypothetical protein